MEFRQHHLLGRPGFSLIEVLITVSIVGLLAGLGWTGLEASHRRAAASAAGESVANLIREAQSRSLAARDGTAWEVRCNGASVTLVSSAHPINETISLTAKTRCAGDPVVFSKLQGRLAADQTWTISYAGADTSRVAISTAGAITTQTL